MRILPKSSLRFHLKHPALLFLTLVGIVLGIGIVVGIFLMTKAATTSLVQSVTQLQGPTTHQITAFTGTVPNRAYVELKKAELAKSISPIYQGTFSIRKQGADTDADDTSPSSPKIVTLLGLDPFSHPLFPAPFPWPHGEEIQVLASSGTGFQEGDRLISPGSEKSFQVWKVIPLGTATLITDVEYAVPLAAVRLDRIEIVATKNEVAGLTEWIQKYPQLRLDPVTEVLEGQQKMMGSFQLGLKALSFLALIVGMFLIYNTMNFSVELRKAHFGTLRLLGVRTDEIFYMISAEAVALGALGGIAGVFVGERLSGLFLGKVIQTVNDLYFSAAPVTSQLSPQETVGFLALGVFASWLASALPAIEAMLSPPRISLSKSQTEERFRQKLKLGIPWLSVGSIAVGLTLLNGLRHEGLFLSLFLVLLGFALWIPQVVQTLTKLALHLTSRSWILLRLSLDATQRNLARTGIAVTALSLAFAVSLGMEQMVSSFRTEMVSWLDSYVHAELYIAPQGYSTSRSDVTLSPSLVKTLAEHPLVQDYSSQRHITAQSNLGKLRLVAVRPSAKIEDLFQARDRVLGYSWKLLQNGGHVAISEALSHRLSLKVGNQIELFTNKGKKSYFIGAIFTDYVTDQGLLFMDREEFLRQFQDELTTTMHFFLKDPKNISFAVSTIQNLPGFNEEAKVTTQDQVKGGSIVIFDRTFQITEALRILAVAISMIGLFSALMALQLGRTYEIGVQRAMGLLSSEIFLILTLQNLWLGFLTGILAIPLSQYIAWFLGSVLNPRSFGWTIPTSLSFHQAISTIGLTLFSSFVAGLYPSYRMSKVELAQTLKEKSEI